MSTFRKLCGGILLATVFAVALGGCANLHVALQSTSSTVTVGALGGSNGIDIDRRLARRAYLHSTSGSIATAVGPGANILETIAISLGTDPNAGSAESICPSASPIDHVEEFRGTAAFDRMLVSSLQRSIVRLSLQPKAQLARTVRDDLGISRIDLGHFTGYEDWNRGFCTGTLITRNIVLTAGHCISPRFWEEEKKLKVPEIGDQSGELQPILGKDFVRLMQVEFNYQNRLIAESNSFQPATYRDDRLSLRVVELISGEYRDTYTNKALDYALLRIEADEPHARQHTEVVALGLGRLQLTPIPADRPIAIIQHPLGFEKKIAAGRLQAMRDWRLFYRVSTEGGSSGAGIFTDKGRLTGVHTRGGCATTADHSANKGMSLHRIKDLIEALRSPTRQ